MESGARSSRSPGAEGMLRECEDIVRGVMAPDRPFREGNLSPMYWTMYAATRATSAAQVMDRALGEHVLEPIVAAWHRIAFDERGGYQEARRRYDARAAQLREVMLYPQRHLWGAGRGVKDRLDAAWEVGVDGRQQERYAPGGAGYLEALERWGAGVHRSPVGG